MNEADIENLLNDIVLREIEREVGEHRIGIYYPSELGFCIRRNYFLYKNPKKLELNTLKVFEAGDLYHNWIHEILDKALIEHISEESLIFNHGEIEIRGRFDEIIILRKENIKILLEIKTVRNISYIAKAKENHVMQLIFYMNRLGFSEGYLVYLDRRDIRFRVFKISYDEEIFKKLIERAFELHNCLISNKIPIAEAKKSKELRFMCDYCYYRQECFEER